MTLEIFNSTDSLTKSLLFQIDTNSYNYFDICGEVYIVTDGGRGLSLVVAKELTGAGVFGS